MRRFSFTQSEVERFERDLVRGKVRSFDQIHEEELRKKHQEKKKCDQNSKTLYIEPPHDDELFIETRPLGLWNSLLFPDLASYYGPSFFKG